MQRVLLKDQTRQQVWKWFLNCTVFYKYKVFFYTKQKSNAALKRTTGIATNAIDDNNSETWVPVLISKEPTFDNIRHTFAKELLVVWGWG